MAKYKLTTTSNAERVIEADEYATVGDFIDFTQFRNGQDMTVMRWRADYVYTIELVD